MLSFAEGSEGLSKGNQVIQGEPGFRLAVSISFPPLLAPQTVGVSFSLVLYLVSALTGVQSDCKRGGGLNEGVGRRAEQNQAPRSTHTLTKTHPHKCVDDIYLNPQTGSA